MRLERSYQKNFGENPFFNLVRSINAACNIKEFGLKALPSERGDVKPVDCPTVDDRPHVLKSRGRKKQEKRRDNSLRSLCL